jgi:magnesium-transporting ATPase (P-type)
MIGTFASILVFTMLKEGWEVRIFIVTVRQDMARHKSDNELNNKKTQYFDAGSGSFVDITWAKVKMGQLLKIRKDEDFPCDIMLLKSNSANGIVFVDTM